MSTASMNWLRRTLRPQTMQRFNRRTPVVQQQQKRRMGGGGGDMPQPQSMKAELWQGHPKHNEGWEMDIYLSYGAATVLIIMALGFAPDTGIQAWAEGEAEARLELKAQGFDKFEFGTHYNTTSSNEEEWEKFNNRAIKPGEDDDDDDDEDDEDEEEDDDE